MRVLTLMAALLTTIIFGVEAQSAGRVQSPTTTVSVAVSKGVLISLPEAAKTVFVADPEVASFQVAGERRVLVFGRMPGQTTVFALGESDDPIYSANVTVAYDTSLMHAALRREFPSLNLKLTPVYDGVAVSGKVPSAETAAQVIAMLDSFVRVPAAATGNAANTAESSNKEGDGDTTPSGAGTGSGTLSTRNAKIINRLTITMPTQVTIRVRVAEVSRTLSEQLGVKWQFGREAFLGGEKLLVGLSGSAVSSGVTFATSTGITGSTGGMPVDLGVLIDALALENLVSILAEPNLSVMSGETANFLAGGEIPFPTSDGDGGTGVDFKEFGVLLGVTPTILSPNRISLRLRPEVSEPSTANGVVIQGAVVPGFTTRRAETTVELASGQSVAIGGLLQNSITNEVSKIPLLGDIPIIGALARSKAFKRGETELVTIATAYISEPSDAALDIPNANIDVPNFFNRMFLGQNPRVSAGSLRPADFIYY